MRDGSWLYLIGMWWWVEYFLCGMQWVGYDNDSLDIQDINCLIDTTSNSEELHFCSRYINGLVICLDDWPVERVDMWYGGGYMVLNTCIQNDNVNQGIWE